MRPTWRLRPGPYLAPAAAVGLPLALLGADGIVGAGLALGLDALLMLIGWREGRGAAHWPLLVEREIDARLVLGVPSRVRVRVHNRAARPVRVAIRDAPPPGFEASVPELRVELPPHARRELEYTVIPPRRGRWRFGDLEARVDGPWRLGAAVLTVPSSVEARVYPDVLGAHRRALSARLRELSLLGVRPVRVAGGGGEIEQLREYVAGDPYRDIDWKATARRARPVTRQYSQERAQQVMLCVDAGRLMAMRMDDGRTRLDHAVRAALLLAFVALRRGDRVGLVVFSDVVHTWVAPGRGPGQYRRLLEALFAVEAQTTGVDFRRLVEVLRARLRRRALVVVFSDLLDESQARPLAEHAGALRPKHLALCVSLHDPQVDALALAPAEDEAAVYRRAAAADLLAERAQVRAMLSARAVELVEATSDELAVATVNRYLEIKARHRL
ncbi:MAG: DUF58 domain-containing protein [Myxococcota bacterium]|nr:DUF58 domain-containing protein [Myxococcota bacterium]MDW8363177.1 DUF58 domain-containing protein [Myxococcales bacterium]